MDSIKSDEKKIIDIELVIQISSLQAQSIFFGRYPVQGNHILVPGPQFLEHSCHWLHQKDSKK